MDLQWINNLWEIFGTHQGNSLPSPSHSSTAMSSFPFECSIAAVSVLFCRLTVVVSTSEPLGIRIILSFVLGGMCYYYCTVNQRLSWIILFWEALSYLPVPIYFWMEQQLKKNNPKTNSTTDSSWKKKMRHIPLPITVIVSVVTFLALSHQKRQLLTDPLYYVLPIQEFTEAYNLIARFTTDYGLLNSQLFQLLFVTIHIQVGMGFLGIDFLRQEQIRRNQLVLVDSSVSNGNEKRRMAEKFQKGTYPFVLFVVLPYMFQLIVFGGINLFSFTCVKDELHRAVRLHALLDHETNLVSISTNSTAKTPGVYATSMDNVISTTYDIINRKLFSLPKLLLLPNIMRKQPKLFMQVFPLILVADKLKAMLVASMTTEIERLNKKRKDLQAKRIKIEGFDVKNADLIQRSTTGKHGESSSPILRYNWAKITFQIQSLDIRHALLKRTKGYFQWLQSQFILKALVDGAIAMLIATGKLGSADIFVFARAMEDAVDFILTRSRSESELSEMATNVQILNELADLMEIAKNNRKLLHCAVIPPSHNQSTTLFIPNLAYTRGTAKVSISNLELPNGIYALTGPNGSGKSSLFRILLGCDSNKKVIDLPQSISILPTNDQDNADSTLAVMKPVEIAEILSNGEQQLNPKHERVLERDDIRASAMIILPSADVVEVSQNFYWPLHTKPIDWIYQELVSEMSEIKRQELVTRVQHELSLLDFKRGTATERIDLSADLLEEKEDWFNELSGGQKCKVELVRKIFVLDSCPKVLLIDETLAPLDPSSKVLVMQRIKSFCSSSIVIVIYHNDVADNAVDYLSTESDLSFTEDISQTCVPSSNFFDDNLHVENGVLIRRALCI